MGLQRFSLRFQLFLFVFITTLTFNKKFLRILTEVNAESDIRDIISICESCTKSQSKFTKSKFEDFCKSGSLKDASYGRYISQTVSGGHLKGRCCISDKVVIGIDLSNCSLNKTVGLFHHGANLKWIALNENHGIQIKPEDFVDLPDLRILYLPFNLSCPGGSGIWNRTEVFEKDNVKLCSSQNSCRGLNVTCPENAHCVTNGPGFYQCLCDKGWYGYRCLRNGVFPTAKWLGGISAGFISVAVFLWLAQKRSIRKLQGDQIQEGMYVEGSDSH